MKLPVDLANHKEWTVLGPMGPELPDFLSGNPLLCVDGGANFAHKMDIWVGDGDSFKKEIHCENIYRFSSDKALSDLALALTLFKDAQSFTLHVWGFLGGRKDHELMNLGEAFHSLVGKPHSRIIFYDSQSGKRTLEILGAGSWPFRHEGTFSLAALFPTQVQILGDCDYPLKEKTPLLPLSSLGLSNKSRGAIQVISEGPVMILFSESI